MAYKFISAECLNKTYRVSGHFYQVRLEPGLIIECRSVLEIVHHAYSVDPSLTPDAIFIMMNPGSSEPLFDTPMHIAVDQIGTINKRLVATKPDTTQYQLMRVMHYCGYRYIRVLNLSDLREAKSLVF